MDTEEGRVQVDAMMLTMCIKDEAGSLHCFSKIIFLNTFMWVIQRAVLRLGWWPVFWAVRAALCSVFKD